MIRDKSLTLWSISFFALISYLVVHTGMASDDFIFMFTTKGKSIIESMDPRLCPHTPIENIFFFFWYPFFSLDNTLLVEVVKTVYTFMSFYMVSKFFGIFLSNKYAFIASFLFLFFPSHDATVYWFLGQYLALSMAFYLFAYYLAHDKRHFLAFISAAVASFLSYGSTTIAVSLFILFVLKKERRNGFIILIPNIIYAIYYLFIGRLIPGAANRLPDIINILPIMKQFIFQIITFIDAVLGPSMWLKIYYSILQLSGLSIAIGAALVLFLAGFLKKTETKQCDIKLVVSLGIMAFLSFGIFAVTGAYPQMAFNLGNRATIFGSLLTVYLIVSAPMAKTMKIIICSVLVFAILGISDHWKGWNAVQKAVFTNIKNNQDLNKIEDGQTIFISGNQYSKFGMFSHIEFFSEGGPDCAVNQVLKKDILVRPLNKRFKYIESYITDAKYGDRIEVGDNIMVYDSEKDLFFRLNKEDINDYVDLLLPDIRHWTQLPVFEPIRKTAVFFMPRLKYAL